MTTSNPTAAPAAASKHVPEGVPPVELLEALPLVSLSNTAKLASEVFIPGSSDMVSGNVGSGITTFLATGALVALLAPASPLLAVLAGVGLRANSFHHSLRGQHLWQH